MFFRRKKEKNTASSLEEKRIEEADEKKNQEIKKREEDARRQKQYRELIESAPLKVFVQKGNVIKRNTLATMPDIKFSNITRSTNLDKLFPMVSIDTETTGLRRSERIIEISALKIMPGFVLAERFSTLINPGRMIPEEVSNINGITNDMVADAPSFGEIAFSLQSFISGCTVIGHNLAFDLEFLHCSGLILSEKAKYIDTLDIAKKTLKSSSNVSRSDDYFSYDVSDYKLDTLCYYYGIYRPEKHRAEADALATAALLEKLINDKTK